ncbi:DUF4017 family protein [Anaerobacillus isosaccharinicus]|uniref:DUF4017 family protein n=1 Tax=Anaerobacillus isosaccharinicus TaxID=1532552 RepID=A0A7S7LCV6_9BACI
MVYLIVNLIAVSIPASEGYDSFGWKLLVGQIYAIPVLIVAVLVSLKLQSQK